MNRFLPGAYKSLVGMILCRNIAAKPEDSSTAKKASKQDASHTTAIGNKIDLRVCTSSPSSKTVDLLNVKFVKDSSNGRFFADHRKVLREAKVNADRFYRSQFLNSKNKKKC